MKKDALKKHHFWILFGLVPLLVLIAVLVINSGVGGAIEARETDIKKSEKDIAAKTNVKPEVLIQKLGEQVDQVKGRKGVLWKANWERQKDLYVWPKNSDLLKRVEGMGLKFGDQIPKQGFAYDEFKKREVYQYEYSNAEPAKRIPGTTGMADTVAPTQFPNGWQAVLRHVDRWGDADLTSEQIWLLMEDIWVQRSMLEAVRAVNAEMARFDMLDYQTGKAADAPADRLRQEPLKRKFRSRTWEVELEVEKRDNRQVLKGRLTNHTDRLQLMAAKGVMTLNVWLQPDVRLDDKGNPQADKDGKPIPVPDVRPFEFRIGGASLPGRGAVREDGKTPANVLDVEFVAKDHTLPLTTTVSEIYKVEQVFDPLTVPVRRIEALALGKTDSRHAGAQLLMPLFPAYEKEAKDAAAAAAAATTPGGEDGGGRPAPIPIPQPPGGGVGEDGRPRPGGVAGAGGGPIETVVEANRKRYIVANPEVRRLPVGIVLVVDQAHQQDVLMAFANSPLRFQVTQVNWARFRGDLKVGEIGGPGAGPGESGVVFSGAASPGGLLGGGFDPDARGPGIRPIAPIEPPGAPGAPFTPGTGGEGYGPYGPGSGTVTAAQLTSGLIELSVYGVVSLYEKYGSDAPPPDAPKDDGKEPRKDR